MKVFVFTQVHENYAWREDGTIGTGAEAYWKAKGGNEYVITGIWDEEEATVAVMAMRDQIETANDYMTETIIDYQLADNEDLTPFEKDQLQYEGRIVYPAKELTWA